jgi:hypothetical protein
MREGRLAMLDWGIVARLDHETHRAFRRLIEASVGMEEAWDDITSQMARVQGPSLYALGLDDAQIARFVRTTIEPALVRPLREVSLAALFMDNDEIMHAATGQPVPKRSLRDRLRIMRQSARWYRRGEQSGSFKHPTLRSTYLAMKQLVYLERYGRMYLPDEAVLGDKEFLRRALESIPEAGEAGD